MTTPDLSDAWIDFNNHLAALTSREQLFPLLQTTLKRLGLPASPASSCSAINGSILNFFLPNRSSGSYPLTIEAGCPPKTILGPTVFFTWAWKTLHPSCLTSTNGCAKGDNKDNGIAEQPEPTALKSLEDNERDHILGVLRKTKGRIRGKGGAAEILKLPPTTLHSRMKKLGITKKHERSKIAFLQLPNGMRHRSGGKGHIQN